MNRRHSIGRVYFRSIWIFTVNLFCRGKTGRMNRWIMIVLGMSNLVRIFMCYRVPLCPWISIYSMHCSQCFFTLSYILRMQTNNFHVRFYSLANHLKPRNIPIPLLRLRCFCDSGDRWWIGILQNLTTIILIYFSII